MDEKEAKLGGKFALFLFRLCRFICPLFLTKCKQLIRIVCMCEYSRALCSCSYIFIHIYFTEQRDRDDTHTHSQHKSRLGGFGLVRVCVFVSDELLDCSGTAMMTIGVTETANLDYIYTVYSLALPANHLFFLPPSLIVYGGKTADQGGLGSLSLPLSSSFVEHKTHTEHS